MSDKKELILLDRTLKDVVSELHNRILRLSFDDTIVDFEISIRKEEAKITLMKEKWGDSWSVYYRIDKRTTREEFEEIVKEIKEG